jgi:O-antigen/teichoic acid export membrane protein
MTVRKPSNPAAAQRTAVSRRTATLVNLAYQYAGVALTIVRGIILVPIFLAYIPVDLYGAWMASGDVVMWILLAEAGTADLVRQQAAQFFGQGSLRDVGAAVGSGLAISVALALVVLGMGLAVAPLVPIWVQFTGPQADELSESVLLAVIATAMGIVCGGVRGAQQGLQRPLGVGMVGIAAELLSIVLSIVLLLAGWRLYSIPVGFLAREVVNNVGCFALYVAASRSLGIPLTLSWARIRQLAGLTGWTFLSRVGFTLGNNSHSFFVAYFLGPAWVPVAAFTRRAWEILYLLLSRLSFSFQPGLAHLWGSGDVPRFQGIVEKMVVMILLTTAVSTGAALALNQAFMSLWLHSPEFFAGDAYNVLSGVANLLNIALFTASQVLMSTGRIRASAVVQLLPNIGRGVLLAAGLALAAPLGLAPQVALWAVPLSTIVANVLVGWPYVLPQWREAARFSVAAVRRQCTVGLKLIVAAALVAWAGSFLPAAGSWWTLGGFGALLAVALVMACVLVDATARREALAVATAAAARLPRRR